MIKKTNLFIAVVVLTLLAGCGTEKSTVETTKKLSSGVQEMFCRGGEEQNNTYTKTISKKELFKNSQGGSFDLEGELIFNKENNKMLSFSNENDEEMASIQAVYDEHTLWLQGRASIPDSIAFNSETYVLYDFETDRVKKVFEGVLSIEDEGIPRGACFSPDGKKGLFRLSKYTSSGEIVYINGETGEKRNMSELIDTEERDFKEVSFLDDSHVFVAQTRSNEKGAPLERGFVWDIKTNEVRQIYEEDEILAFNSEKSIYTQGQGFFIIGEKIDRYRIANTYKEFFVEGVKLLHEYEFFPMKDKAVLLKTEENEEGQEIIKELGILDLEKERLTFLEDAAVLGKEYDTRHLEETSDGSVATRIYASVCWKDESSFAVNVKDGFYLYSLY